MRLVVRLGFFSLLLSVMLSACTSTKNIAYFQNINDSVRTVEETIQSTPIMPTIDPDDILLITIAGSNPAAASIFNQGQSDVMRQRIGATSTTESMYEQAADTRLGYLVDSSGHINLPVLGSIKLEGLTLHAAQDTIAGRLRTYLSNPIVNIRFLNYKITILGEVTRPGTYTIPNQQITLLQALGLAGDMTIFGKRTNVLVVRQKNGQRQYGRINLNNSKSLFTSPYYNLQQNDVVYVEPRKSKAWNSDQAALRNVSLIVTILSALTIIATRF